MAWSVVSESGITEPEVIYGRFFRYPGGKTATTTS